MNNWPTIQFPNEPLAYRAASVRTCEKVEIRPRQGPKQVAGGKRRGVGAAQPPATGEISVPVRPEKWVLRQSSMRRGRTQAHEKGMHHMFASIGIGIATGIGIGGHLDADADSDPDSDPEISAISVLFSEPEPVNEKSVDTPTNVLVRFRDLYEADASSRRQSDIQNCDRFRMKAMAGSEVENNLLMRLLPESAVVIVAIIILGRFRRFG